MNWIKRHKFLTAVIVVVGLILIGSAGSKSTPSSTSTTTTPPSGVDSNNSGNHAAASDVVLTSCANGQYGPTVKVTITNHTSKRSNYMVEVSLLDSSGNKVGDGIASSSNVESDQIAYEDVFATSNGDFTKCQIVSVTRYAA